MKAEVTFDDDDIRRVLAAEYRKQFGEPQDGHEVSIIKLYGEWTAKVWKKPETSPPDPDPVLLDPPVADPF